MASHPLVEQFRAGLPYPLDPFQEEAMVALAEGHSVLVSAPTGTGKTVVAEFGVFLARGRGLRALYTTPIKALSNQKFRDFRSRYGDAEVGLLTGDVVVNGDAAIVVMTTEVLRNQLVTDPAGGGWGSLADVAVVVFDEVHYMGDPERGTAWEEAILLAPAHVQLVCLSATVPNAGDIGEWIREAHGDLSCVFHDERAVPIEHRYWLPDQEATEAAFRVWPILDPDGQTVAPTLLRKVGGELASRVRWGGPIGPGTGDHGAADDDDRAPRDVPAPWRVLRYLESQELTPSIYFLFSRRATEQAAASCLALRPVAHAAGLVREAKSRLADMAPADRALRQVSQLLGQFLPRGVAVHHAGLLPQLKMLVEELFQAGKLRAVFATDTLALGINMPARTVVVAEFQKYDGVQRRLLSPNEYRQMTGRAGRRGIDERGVSLVLYSPWVTFPQAMNVINGELLPLESAFRPTYSTAMNLWLRPEDEERLADLYARSLRRFQHDRALKELTERKQALEDQFERERSADRSGRTKRRDVSERAHELTRADYELRQARRAATVEAKRTVQGLVQVLERYDYLRAGQPTAKSPYLRRLFDTNALTLCELLTNRQLEGLEPPELAEALSWFATDRDSPMRGLALTQRLHRLREILDALHGGVLSEEERHNLQISRPLPAEFHGVALAWAEGEPLVEIAQRARLQEGDLVAALQKTLDLIGQLKGAALRGPLGEGLVASLDEADRLLRHGVVEAGYRWAVGGLPEIDDTADAVAERDQWVVPAFVDDATDQRFERRPTPGPRRRAPAFVQRRGGGAARSPRRRK